MKIAVKLFATMRDKVGKKEVSVQLPEGATIAALREQLLAEYPALTPVMDSGIFAVNRQFASLDTVLVAGDQVALFPPVSGGAGPAHNLPELCQIASHKLDVNQVVRRLTLPTTGAVVTFTGTVRAADKDGRQVRQLHYEAYAAMAQAKLRQVAAEMRQRFPAVEGIALIQRVGVLEGGEPTIVVAVSSPHRDQGCFEAARYGIDRIKEIVPVWKQEIGPEGEVWVEGHYQPKAGD